MTTSPRLLSLCRNAAACLALAFCATARAETVLDNLVAPDTHTASGGTQLGAAIQIGSTPIVISTVEFHQFYNGGYLFSPGQTFAVHSRNADGTVGAVLFSDFALLDGGTTLLTKASANSPFVLQANTIYWLILTAPPDEDVVLWNYTKDPTYNSALDVSIPAQNAAYYTYNGATYYFPLSEGPQELRVTGTAALPAAPMAERAVSRIVHGNAGEHDVELPLSGAAGVECRSGGPAMEYQLVFFFPSAVTFQSAAVTTGTGSVTAANVSATPGGGSQVVVHLGGVTDAQRLGVTLHGVHNGTGTGDVGVRVGMLLGDTTGNGTVSASDIGAAKAQSGQPVTAANFRTDVTTNGSINASDMGVVKSRAGATLPAARGGAAETR